MIGGLKAWYPLEMPSFSITDKARELESQSPQEVLQWALKTYGNKIALASSFGAEDVVLIDMLMKIDPKARVFTLDTGRLNPETYNVMDEIRQRYGLKLEVMFPNTAAAEKMVREKGFNLFYESIENRKECCGVRKVEPLGRMLKELDAWITGLRREQSVTRTEVAKVEQDPGHPHLVKVNPIADWNSKQVWDYIKANNVPYNVLHKKGYPSIGCAPCTRAVQPGQPERAGRWWWENPDTKECGLHVGTGAKE